MDNISRQEARRVLLEGVGPKRASRVISVLNPLIVKAEGEMYLLSSDNHVPDEDIQLALGMALDNWRTEIFRISMTTGPFPKSRCISTEFYRKVLAAFLSGEVDHKTNFALTDRYCRKIQHRCMSLVSLEHKFHDLLGTRLCSGLRNAVRRTECHEKQWEDGWREAYRVVRTAVTYYLAFAQIGDESGLDKLEQMVILLPKVIPIGCATFCFERKFVLVR